MDAIWERLRQHLATTYLKLPPDELPDDQPLISSGLVDSFNLVDLALFVEREFGVHIDDTELNSASFDTLGQLTALIHCRL